MSTTIQASEQWMDGFVKAAEAAGLTPEQIPALFKTAHRLKVRAANPAAFDSGYAEIMEKKGIGLGTIAKMLAGGGLMAGGSMGFNALGDMFRRHKMYNDAETARKLWVDKKTTQDHLDSLPIASTGGRSQFAGGSYGNPYVPF